MYCKKCGCPISEDAVFCKKCGEKQHQGIESAAVHSHQGKDFLKKFSVVFRRVFRTTASKIIAGVLAAAILVTGIAVIVNNQNKNRFVSDSISVVVEPTLKYDNVSSFSEGFAVVEKDKKYGYVDQNGKEVVPPTYYSAGSFSDGVAVAYSKEDCTWHIIDKTGNVKAQLKGYDNVGYSFSNGFIQVEKDDKYGLADTAGKEVLPPVYDFVGDFNDGLAWAEKNEMWGLIDIAGNEVLPFIYSQSFNEGFSRVKEDGNLSLVDKAGKEVLILPHDYYSVRDFNDGVAVIHFVPGDIWYIIDKTGNVKAQLKDYRYVSGFSEGFAQVTKDGKYGFVDKNGKDVVPPIYDDVQDFNEGFAQVAKDGKYGFVDQTGKEVVPLIYDSVDSFSDGLARVEKDGKRNYIDKTGKEVVPSEYDLGWGEFSEGFADVKKGEKYGYIDKNGNETVPMIYDETREFSEGLAWVRQGKKWGILKINEPTSNDPSSITTSDVPTASSSTDTSATAINIDDYIGMWHIDGQNYDSNYVAAYETELGIEKLSNNKFSFWLIREHKYEISCETTLNGNMADFTCEDGQYIVIGTLTFNQNSITVNITSSDMPYNPVGTITFDRRHGGIYDDGRGEDETNDTSSGSTCPRCGRTLTDGETCDCTWCDICNAWMLGHGHGEGEEPVDSSTSQSSNDSNSAQNGTGSTADYDYSFEGNEITITKYKGSGDTVVIPATIDGKRVTVIGGTAFSERFDLTSVTIPASVISIRDRSFDFSHFKSIYFEGNAPSLEDYAWEKLNCMWDVFYYKPGTTGWTSPPWDAYDKETW